MPRWEIRAKLRWGSEHIGFLVGLRAAKAFAREAIKRSGGAGRIEMVDRNRRILYFHAYPVNAHSR